MNHDRHAIDGWSAQTFKWMPAVVYGNSDAKNLAAGDAHGAAHIVVREEVLE